MGPLLQEIHNGPFSHQKRSPRRVTMKIPKKGHHEGPQERIGWKRVGERIASCLSSCYMINLCNNIVVYFYGLCNILISLQATRQQGKNIQPYCTSVY